MDIYKDKGISGTSIHKRLDFQRMINDAVAGKIDLILTKSISRFGRNIVDILNNLRLLSSLPNPVSVEFETEGITYSGDGGNNLVITILSALAEMESQQKSEAIKSVGFLCAILFGYIAGITGKLINPVYMAEFSTKWYILFFYCLNFCMVFIDFLLYFRNRRLDKMY